MRMTFVVITCITVVVVAITSIIDMVVINFYSMARLIHIGQFLIDLAAPVAMGGPPLVSSTWFPPHQRATATAIASLMSYVGISISFGVGPFILNPSEVADPPNSTEESLVDIRNISNS